MYTQCPECLTVFSLEATTLAQARGRVVCGHCHASFDALARLTDERPDRPGTRLRNQAPSNELPIITGTVATATGDLQTRDPVIADPVISDPIAADPITIDPITTDPVVIDPIGLPMAVDPIATDPADAESAFDVEEAIALQRAQPIELTDDDHAVTNPSMSARWPGQRHATDAPPALDRLAPTGLIEPASADEPLTAAGTPPIQAQFPAAGSQSVLPKTEVKQSTSVPCASTLLSIDTGNAYEAPGADSDSETETNPPSAVDKPSVGYQPLTPMAELSPSPAAQVSTPSPAQTMAAESAEPATEPVEGLADDAPPAAPPPLFTPRFAQPKRRHWRGLWLALCVLLALLLAAQLAWVERDRLIANPTTGGWLRGACQRLGCQLPLVQDLHQLRLLARDVQSHPSVSGALMISATIRNDAAFAQPYPVLSVVLSDVDGKKLAMRRLGPTDYLNDAAALKRGVPAHSNMAVVLEVDDPGSRAVAFEVGFQ